jgi:hypothetical protein
MMTKRVTRPVMDDGEERGKGYKELTKWWGRERLSEGNSSIAHCDRMSQSERGGNVRLVVVGHGETKWSK